MKVSGRRPPLRAWGAAVLGAGAIVVLTGAQTLAAPSLDLDEVESSLETTVAGPEASAAARSGGDVEVKDFRFAPKRFEVEVGDTVVWEHTGRAPHTVTADDGSFDSHPGCSQAGTPSNACMQNGDRYRQTFEDAGTVRYFCRVHGDRGGEGMAGTIEVVQEGGDARRSDTGGNRSSDAGAEQGATTDDGTDPASAQERGAGRGDRSGGSLASTGAEPLVPVAAGLSLVAAGTGMLFIDRRKAWRWNP